MMQAVAPEHSLHRLMTRLEDARRRSDALFRIVRNAALYDRPIPERHRIVFYIGHLEAFDWNLLARTALGREAFHASFDKLFAFGIDPVDGGLPQDQPADWPSLAEVHGYVARVREEIDGLIARSQTDTNNGAAIRAAWNDGQLLHVAIEHRLMHAETLAYMLHQLPLEKKHFQPRPAPPVAPPVEPRMIEIPAGVATLGMQRRQPFTDEAFGWDNEFGEQRVESPAFRIASHKVTNREFLEFVRAGGYAQRNLWTDAAWAWKEAHGITHPGFWVKRGSNGGAEFFYRSMFEEFPLPLDWPVYVSQAEAAAYAKWMGKRLPTEAEWHRAAFGTPRGEEQSYPWGESEPQAYHGNFDFARWDPVPVGSYSAGHSAFGVEGMVGNGWEWTSTVFGPLPGFEAFPFYKGYSADFFDGKHFVMKGGSARTAACMLRRTFRNWFQPHYPYVYTGFRLAE